MEPQQQPPQTEQTPLERRIPPQLQGQLEAARALAQQLFGPLVAEFGPLFRGWWLQFRETLRAKPKASTEGGPTLGGQFRHLLVVGLNRSELLLAGETQPVWNDSWQELLDDTMRRHLGLVFFAPRDLSGAPVAPIPFLMGESPDEGAVTSTQVPSVLQGVALLDFCRLEPAQPNTVNMIVAADCLFHWDVKDTYVLPTSNSTWVRDAEAVMKGYPRTTRAQIFTQWDTSLLNQNERVSAHSLRALPLQGSTWLNEPTLQEKYASHALVAGIVAVALVWAGLWWQGRGLAELTDQLNMVQQQIPRGGQFSDLERAIAEQEKQFERRPLFALALRDTHRAIAQSGLEVEEIELKAPDTNEPPNSYLLTLTMPIETYAGWLQQEPVARKLILNSAMLHAVRKPPGTGFKLEGLIMLQPWMREFKRLLPQLPASVAPALLNSPTTVRGSSEPEAEPDAEAQP